MPQPRHHRCTQHVQYHLLRSPCLQPRRSCQHFRPHLWRDHNLRQPPHRHAQIRRHRHRHRPALPSIFQRAQNVRRRPARRNSHHHVLPRQFFRPQILFSVTRRIFCPFHRLGNRASPPRNQRLHQLWRSPKRRRALGRIQHSHPPARSRLHINQPSAVSNPVHNCIHRSRNRRILSSHRHRHLAVLAVHQPHNLPRRHAVQILRRRIPLFRATAFREHALFCVGGHGRIISVCCNAPLICPGTNTSLVNAKHSNSPSARISTAGVS